ncbi:flavodoxin [Cloacibacillus evryensis]|uniref:flavodoxin n=1 Tax=Cloacibacillus evryensis TaxID=508460 RepID=UPI00241FCB9A|nr:flavodoxin [Cloacibacillus evryensis]
MKALVMTILAMAALFGWAVHGEAAPALAGKKPLIVYFSWGGNTRVVANQIKELTGGDLFEAQTVKSYPKEYRATTEQAKNELNSNARPALKVSKLPNLDSYDTVIICHPNWWGTMPTAMMTLLEANDLSGKKIFKLHQKWHNLLAHVAPDKGVAAKRIKPRPPKNRDEEKQRQRRRCQIPEQFPTFHVVLAGMYFLPTDIIVLPKANSYAFSKKSFLRTCVLIFSENGCFSHTDTV